MACVSLPILGFLLLLTGSFEISGPAVGPGVERAVIRKSIKLIAADAAHWRHLDDLDHVTWAVRSGVSASRLRLVRAKAHGTLCALHMVWLGSAPYPISPWLFLLVISGFPAILDLRFITALNPSLAERLAFWPLDNTVTLDLAPMSIPSQLIATHLHNVTVGIIL